ncbi:MAG: hypothetical protein M3R59_01335 [Verrucomicrobiota bacterium]|nr:hypothetical protein [Verrucomicrobiota bacterium]
MALQLNLLHEEIQEQRQRQRDPLKIGMFLGISVVALLALYYLLCATQVITKKARLSSIESDWAKVEPKVTLAKKRSDELNDIIGSTKLLDDIIDNRFYWAPTLEKISHCVTPNIQITSLDGSVVGDNTGITITLEGLAGGREPRAVAEDFRQMLLEQIGKDHSDVKVEFKTLEDLDTLVNVGSVNVATAHFSVSVNFNPFPKKAAPAAPRGKRAAKDA